MLEGKEPWNVANSEMFVDQPSLQNVQNYYITFSYSKILIVEYYVIDRTNPEETSVRN